MRNASCGQALHVLSLEGKAAGAPLIIAHRGYSKLAPENTLPAFELAGDAKAEMIELDARCSRDGKLLVVHDAELDRTTDAVRRWHHTHNRVDHHDAEESRTLDAGSWFGHRFAGTRIPLVAEAIRAILARGAVPLVERKSGTAAEYLELFRTMDVVDRVILQSFDWKFLQEVHEAEPGLSLGALGPAARLANGRRPLGFIRRLNARWLEGARKTGAKVVVWDRRVSRKAIGLAHDKGLKVWVYTVDRPGLARRLLDAGVDGIITNDPGQIGGVVRSREGLRPLQPG